MLLLMHKMFFDSNVNGVITLISVLTLTCCKVGTARYYSAKLACTVCSFPRSMAVVTLLR